MKFFKLFLILLGIFNASSICHAGRTKGETTKKRVIRKESATKHTNTKPTKNDTVVVKKGNQPTSPITRIIIPDSAQATQEDGQHALTGKDTAVHQQQIIAISDTGSDTEDKTIEESSSAIITDLNDIIDASAAQLHESASLNSVDLTSICDTNRVAIQEKIAAIMKDLSYAERCALAAELNNEHSWAKFFKDKINYAKEHLPTKKQVAYSIAITFIITTVVLSSYAWITLGSDASTLGILEFNLTTIKDGLIYTYTTISSYLSGALSLIGSAITRSTDAACEGYNGYITAPAYLSQIQAAMAESTSHAAKSAACSYTLSKIQECLSTASSLSVLSSDGIYARMVPQYANALIGKCVQAVFSEIPTA